ncbi:hypothetical protein [Vibrio jasicida]|uniref:hypothetical protein n=1 Tax=Vibrio jasicida TaxID=766224 RepID=UPI0005F0BCE5|nr:hypothetical protein [Vibrio jasicida]
MDILRLGILSVFVYGLMGCSSTLDSFYNRDVIEDSMKGNDTQISALSVTSSRRVIIANMDSGHFCAEPPPETTDNVKAIVEAALEAKVQSAKIDTTTDVSTELKDDFTKTVKQLFQRSQTIQLYRDVAFYYCVDAINNSTKTEYNPYSDKLDIHLPKFIELMKKELTLLKQQE